jgi:hypothetical protein
MLDSTVLLPLYFVQHFTTTTKELQMKTEMNLVAATEELGRVKASIADLKKVEDNLKGILINAAAHDIRDAVIDGPTFRSTVSFADRTTVRWGELASVLALEAGLSEQQYAKLKAKFSDTVSSLPIVRVGARKA